MEDPSTDPEAKATFDREKLEFNTHDGQKLTFPYSMGGNLPLMFLDPNVSQAGLSSEMALAFDTSPVLEEAQHLLLDSNHNMSQAQKELMLWHYRLGHAGSSWIQEAEGPCWSQVIWSFYSY